MNRVIVSGRNVRDVEVRNVGEHKVAKFAVAVWRAGDKQEDGTFGNGFFTVECWGKTAERVEKDLVKGGEVAVDGRLRYHVYEVEGTKKYETYIVADYVDLPFEKKDGEAAAGTAKGSKKDSFDEDNPWD